MKSLTPFLVLLSLVFLLFTCQKEEAVPEDEFWEVADPVRAGLHPDSLALARANAAKLENFYALIVVKDGKLVVEDYFRGKGESDLFHLRSLTKNITSALTGMAMQEGHINNLDAKASHWFPDALQGAKEAITIRHLLNMTAGFDWNEDTEVIDLIENRVPDPLAYLLRRELSDAPGSHFNYNSLSPQVVAAIIEKETQLPFEQYAMDMLFDPLSIGRYAWTRDPSGNVWAGFGLQLRARDLARFGLLYLQEGRWEGRSVVPASWIDQSSRSQQPTGSSGSGYSLQWWVSENLDDPLYYGIGFGGQGLLILPEQQMLVIGLQESRVGNPAHVRQWNNFVREVFYPIYRAAEK